LLCVKGYVSQLGLDYNVVLNHMGPKFNKFVFQSDFW